MIQLGPVSNPSSSEPRDFGRIRYLYEIRKRVRISCSAVNASQIYYDYHDSKAVRNHKMTKQFQGLYYGAICYLLQEYSRSKLVLYLPEIYSYAIQKSQIVLEFAASTNIRRRRQIFISLGMPESNMIKVSGSSAAILRKDEAHPELQDAKTTYALARATPLSGLERVFTFRPKLLFQLQELSGRTRPRPVIDVVASNTFSTKLSQEFWSRSGRKRMWGGREFIFLKSENYSASDDVSRETLAIIVDQEKNYEKAEIHLTGGHRWKASWLPNGVFEFVREDWNLNDLPTAAWKPTASLGNDKDLVRTTSTNDSTQQSTFSFVYSWHHQQPVLASLTPRHLDISTDLSGASSFGHGYRSSITQPTFVSEELLDTFPAPSAAAEEFDGLKLLIQITGLWVTLCSERCTNS